LRPDFEEIYSSLFSVSIYNLQDGCFSKDNYVSHELQLDFLAWEIM